MLILSATSAARPPIWQVAVASVTTKSPVSLMFLTIPPIVLNTPAVVEVAAAL